MDLFFAFVTLLNIATMAAVGYYLRKLPEYLDRCMSEEIRKQDDRIRKRTGVVNNGKHAEQETAQEGATQTQGRGLSRPQAGQSYRRRHTDSDR